MCCVDEWRTYTYRGAMMGGGLINEWTPLVKLEHS